MQKKNTEIWTKSTSFKQIEQHLYRFEQARKTKNRIKKHYLIIHVTFAAEIFKTK